MRGTRPARIARSADAAARVTERSTLASGPDPRPRLSRRTQLSGKCAAYGRRAGPRATCSGSGRPETKPRVDLLAREFLDHRAALLLGMLELAAETLGRLAAVLRLEALLLDPQQMLLDVALARLELLARRFAVGGRRDRPLDAGGRRSAFIRLQPADASPGHAQLDAVAHEVDVIAVLPVAVDRHAVSASEVHEVSGGRGHGRQRDQSSSNGKAHVCNRLQAICLGAADVRFASDRSQRQSCDRVTRLRRPAALRPAEISRPRVGTKVAITRPRSQ